MHTHSIEPWQHGHVFLGAKHDRHERRTWFVMALTAAMMVAEIVGGTIFGSMAVVADGWHMSTHAGALTIAALAYRFARRHARDPRFSFGTGKVGELAAFSSAVILALIAAAIDASAPPASGNSGTVSLIGPSSRITRLTMPRAGRPVNRFVTIVSSSAAFRSARRCASDSFASDESI